MNDKITLFVQEFMLGAEKARVVWYMIDFCANLSAKSEYGGDRTFIL